MRGGRGYSRRNLNLEPLAMCMSSPSIPAPPPPPPPPQDIKAPDLNSVRKKTPGADAPIAGGTLLTGPSGVANNSLNVGGGSSLLGG